MAKAKKSNEQKIIQAKKAAAYYKENRERLLAQKKEYDASVKAGKIVPKRKKNSKAFKNAKREQDRINKKRQRERDKAAKNQAIIEAYEKEFGSGAAT